MCGFCGFCGLSTGGGDNMGCRALIEFWADTKDFQGCLYIHWFDPDLFMRSVNLAAEHYTADQAILGVSRELFGLWGKCTGNNFGNIYPHLKRITRFDKASYSAKSGEAGCFKVVAVFSTWEVFRWSESQQKWVLYHEVSIQKG